MRLLIAILWGVIAIFSPDMAKVEMKKETDEELEQQDILEEARLMTEPYSESSINEFLNDFWKEMHNGNQRPESKRNIGEPKRCNSSSRL